MGNTEAERRPHPHPGVAPDASSVAAHQGLHVSQAHAFSRYIRSAGTAERLEHLGQIRLGNPPSVILNREHRFCGRALAGNTDLARPTRLKIVDRIDQDVAEHLLQRSAVRHDPGQCPVGNIHLRLLDLMGEALQQPLQQDAHIDALEMQFPPSQPGELQHRIDQVAHPAGGRIDKLQGLGDFLTEDLLQLRAFFIAEMGQHLAQVIVDHLKGMAQLSSKAFDIHQRGAQVVRDDIGKALHLFVSAHQVFGALVHPHLQLVMGGAERLLGAFALGDVADDAEISQGHPLVAHDCFHRLADECLLVFAQAIRLEWHQMPVLRRALRVVLWIFPGKQHLHLLADNLLRVIAEQVGEGGIDHQDLMIHIREDHRVGDRLKYGPEFGGDTLQRLFDALALAQILLVEPHDGGKHDQHQKADHHQHAEDVPVARQLLRQLAVIGPAFANFLTHQADRPVAFLVKGDLL